MKTKIPYIKVTGDNWERGYSHGSQCTELIRKNLEICKSLCCYMRKVSWDSLLMDVKRFRKVICKYDWDLYKEMEGIASGAGLSVDDIIFLNVRTELMNAVWNKASLVKEGCTSIFVGTERTDNNKIYMAQTWDWIEASKEVIIMLHSNDRKGHQFITVTEAGIIGSMGINNKGVTVLLNYLPISDFNVQGTPYHILLRRALDSQTMLEAQCNVIRSPIAFALNIMIGDSNGKAIDMELTAKGIDLHYPERDLLVHTNHLLSQRLMVREVKALYLQSNMRLKTVFEQLYSNYSIELSHVKQLFTNHKHKTFEICKHAINKNDACTVFTVIFELHEQKFYLSYGLPCQNEFISYDLKELFS